MGDLTRIAQIMAEAVSGPNGQPLPDRLCHACVDALTVESAAVVLMAGTGHRAGLWATDEHAQRLEDRQFSLGEGPTMAAFRTRRPVLAADLLTPGERWPVLSVALAQHGTGLRAAYAFPLQLGAACIGVLGLYRGAPAAPGEEEVADFHIAATAVTLAMVGSFAQEDGAQARPWLDHPPADGVEVDQAVGMVMVQLGVRAEDALDRLRAYAFAHGLDVDEAAHEVVQRRVRLGGED